MQPFIKHTNAIIKLIYLLMFFTRLNSMAMAEGKRMDGAAEEHLSENIFIKAVPSKNKVYLGEPFTLSYLLYYHIPVIDPQNEIDVKFKNCFVEEFPTDNQTWEETINGKVYHVLLLQKYFLIPQLEGPLKIPTLSQYYKFNMPPDPDDFFGEEKIVSKKITSKAISVEVMALPAPNDSIFFSNAVGQFSFKPTYTISQKSANMLAFQLDVRGAGNLKNAKLIMPDLPAGIEAFNYYSTGKHTLTEHSLQTAYTFTFDLVATYQGEYTIPEMKFLYFNPEEEKYMVYASPAYTWQVKEGPLPAATPGQEKRVPFMFTKLTLFQNNTGSLFLGSASFYTLLVLSGLFFLTGFVISYQARLRTEAPALYQYKRAKSQAIKAVKKLQSAKENKETDAYIKSLISILEHYLCNKLYIRYEDFSLSNLKLQLESKQVPGQYQAQVLELLQSFYERRFSPAESSKSRSEYCKEVISSIQNVDRNLNG